MEESDLINQLRDIVGNEAIAPDVDFDHAALRDKLPLATSALPLPSNLRSSSLRASLYRRHFRHLWCAISTP